MFRILSLLSFLVFLGSALPANAEYEIRGKINLSDSWQHQIFLATVNKLDDYYNANPEFIIQVGNINEDGTFTLRGDNLPLEPRFYRLYLIKEENSEFDACLYVGGDDHNFIHLILDNNTQIEIQSDPNHFAPFGNYTVIGDQANQELRDLSMMIFPSFYFYQIKFPSELQFSQQKLNRDLFDFADSCDHILVALSAIMNTDMDKYYDLEAEKYLGFGIRLSAELNNHPYTENYFRKMNYYNGDLNESSVPTWVFPIIGALLTALLLALLYILKLKNQLSKVGASTPTTLVQSRPTFTRQEEKILSLILEEKSNKEIASELFIELSTVKTHINKLYAKLGAKNRAEAKSLAKTLDSIGV